MYARYAYSFLLHLQDVRFAGQVLFVIIVLLISWSGVKAIESNYQLQRQISALRQQTAIQNLKNENLKLQNQYYNTNQYLELSARQNFGLAAPGETELIVPKDVALGYAAPTQTSRPSTPPPTSKQSKFERNYQAWLDFFMHRQS